MKISTAHFDLDILDGETIWQIEREVKAQERAMNHEINNYSNGLPEEGDDIEREYDYDSLLTESKKEITAFSLPPPSDKMFSTNVNRGRNCPVTSTSTTNTTAEENEFKNHHYRPMDYFSHQDATAQWEQS